MRPLSGGASTVAVEGASLRDVLAALDAAHPGFKDRLFDAEGALHKFLNVFVSDDGLSPAWHDQIAKAGAELIVAHVPDADAAPSALPRRNRPA